MQQESKKQSLVMCALRDCCPFCGRGKVFTRNHVLKMPVLNHTCSHCKHDFTGEPGYYIGAMYVSYGLAVIMGLSTFLICRFLIGIQSLPLVIAIVAAVLVLTSLKNYKVSRILWLRIFPPDRNVNMQKSA